MKIITPLSIMLSASVLSALLQENKMALAKYAADFTKAAKPKWELFLKYAKVELVPPKPNELGQVAEGFKNVVSSFKSGRYKELTVKEAWLNTLVATEVVMWFFVGEVIGRAHLVGYSFPR